MIESGAKTKGLSVKLATFGAYLFLFSVVVVTGVALLIGYEAIVWPTMLLVYPSLMLITGGIGFHDLTSIVGRRRKSKKDSILLTISLSAGRGAAFSAAFFLCLFAEIKIIQEAFGI